MLFKDIVGQAAALEYLKACVSSGKVAPAYIFAGKDGTGRSTVARAFAKMLNCEKSGVEPCDNCPTCARIESGNYPDLYWIKLAEEEESIKIDALRAMQERVYLKPFEGRKKVFVIEDAGLMTEEAANCLLKTLEEPPLNSCLILIADAPSRLLPTIVSRCKIVKLLPFSKEDISAMLETQPGLSEASRELILNYSEGSIGIAQEIISSDLFSRKNEIIDEFAAETAQLPDYKKEDFLNIVRILYGWYRDILLTSCGACDSVINADRKEDLSRLAEGLSFGEVLRRLGLLEDIYNSIKLNANVELAQAALYVKLNE